MTYVISLILIFLIGVIVHEVAHGYVAYRMGDTTAKDAGRLTINPIAHVDLMGTIILPILLLASRSPVIFGWAKPVPFNPVNFKDPKKGILFTSLAGPLSNFALAVLFALLFKASGFFPHSWLMTFCIAGVAVNVVLGIFNLIPIPPLDGSKILWAALPPQLGAYFIKAGRFGFILIIALLYLGFFDRVIFPLVEGITHFLLGV